MKTISCDFCGSVIKDDDCHYNLKFIHSFKVLWFHRDSGFCFDEDDICESCFSKFLKVYDEFRNEVRDETKPF